MTPELRRSIAAIRFGYGLNAHGPAPEPGELVLGLTRPDGMAQRHPVPRFDDALATLLGFSTARQAERKGDAGAKDQVAALDKTLRAMAVQSKEAIVLRALDTPQPLRERLVHFWADHFTVRVGAGPISATISSYLYETIGQNLTGRFSDMLKAVATHPLMLWYLDQHDSIGPNSPAGKRQGKGLNENYARELLELHTLGSRGSYAQKDVRQLAELLAGMRFQYDGGFRYLERMTEPGPETILGETYGGPGPGDLRDVFAALEDLSIHPDTARHLSEKLAVHFVGTPADAGLADHLADIWRRTGGDLLQVTAGLLDHPAAWVAPEGKVKPPFDYIVSGLRALGVGSTELKARDKAMRQVVWKPMEAMGQVPFRARGPDGWSEVAEDWVTPQGLASRIRWAMRAPGQLMDTLPDPRDFVGTALGPVADGRLIWAAAASETRAQGVGLVLSSPGFIRR